MVRKKIDNRIRVLIENGVKIGHRTFFVIVGDKGRDQVVILHHMLAKAEVKARPSVLWCYKKELGFSSNRKKRMKHMQHKLQAGKLTVNEDDPFELFISSTKIRYCYYSETHKILGNTYGMCVLQDFEAITPNLLARTIETVEGGGLVVLLLRSLNSLKQLYTLSMDVHQRFRTEAHQNVSCRFNERFLLSLASCKRCLVVDDQLSVLPISSHNLHVNPVDAMPEDNTELNDLKESLKDTQPISSLVNCCKTLDQAKSLLKFIEAISEKTLRSTVSLTASRGRGKSASLGLAVAAAVAFGYSNIFVTSPSPENLNTFFEFVFKGFDSLEYQEHLDYGLVQSTNPEFNKAIVRVNVFKDHRQTIQYIHPTDAAKLSQAELLIIDEAAAIPMPFVKAMLGPYLVFLASTINGYEGTGRSLSMKLLQQLRTQAAPAGANTNAMQKKTDGSTGNNVRSLHEVTLDESIRYKAGDAVELWLTKLLCLDSTSIAPIMSGCPPPDNCDLYYINRDTLFCYHRASEEFLQRLVALYVASHYKNSPNDLQMMSDAPAHHLFCLLGPVPENSRSLPEVLCVIQVCLEGEISKDSVQDGFTRGKRASGDLIPWTIGQQYQDPDFPRLSGARIVRIATHPDYQGMGYGARAINLLRDYYEFKMANIDEQEDEVADAIEPVNDSDIGLLEETIEPRKKLPPLLLKLNERRPEKLDYLGVSYGLTQQLLKFWKRAGYIPVYLRQTTNDITGEHTCIMINVLHSETRVDENSWLKAYSADFRRRFVSLLSYDFSKFNPALALSVLDDKSLKINATTLSKHDLGVHLTNYDVKRLEMYSNNLVDYHLITDLMPAISRMFFLNEMGEVSFSAVQRALLLGVGLQHKSIDLLSTHLDLPVSQLLALFNRVIRRCVQYLNGIYEEHVEQSLMPRKEVTLTPVAISMQEELDTAAYELKKKQKKELEKLKEEGLQQFAIKGSEEEWGKALHTKSSKKNIISVKSGEKRLNENTDKIPELEPTAKKVKKNKQGNKKQKKK